MQNQEYEALINSCNKENAVRFLRTVFGKDFGGKEESAAEGISIVGSVTLVDADGRPKPVLCSFKAMEKNLTERSSRRKQFDDSVKVLKHAFARPYMGNGPVKGVFTQGLFFFCDGNGNFRLSLVTSEIANGKHELNNYRRQSFFVESKERNNTFRHRLCKRISNFAELKEAFNVEKLSDDFFREYKVFYEDIVQYITGARFIEDKKNHYIREVLSAPCNDIFDQFIECYDTTDNAEKAVRNYVKKLMGRLVFVQFLQKKGWLGISVEKSGWNGGDLRFLQNLFANASEEEKNDFIDRVLEDVLFYVFNTKETERKFKNKLLKQYKFPFLNGGLFEMDGDDKLKFVLPAEAFSNENSEIAGKERRNPYHKGWTKKRKPYFNKDACGLFDFFDRYNFTIDENDPTDAEVSVDPEMLGKIFENLLEDNKDKGAFYTPKEIVNYMVNESLIAYLDHSGKDATIRDFVLTQKTSDFDEKKKSQLNEKLNDIKICDPAIGSGAFPMGILNALVKCRLALSDLPDEKNALANFKRHIIQNNIYGVDIEKGAVDIARLRFWLSLVVDEEKPEALPNLDFKIMQGNSLLECYEGIDLSSVTSGEKKRGPAKSSPQVSLVFDEDEAKKQIQKDLKNYYRTQEHGEKNSLKKAINEGVKNYLKFIAPEKRKEIDAMEIPNDKFFLWQTYFYDVFKQGGFDVVIGNPPYGANIDRLVKILEKFYPETSKGFKDIYKYFFSLGLSILSPKSILCYITPSTFLRQPRYADLRNVLLRNKICQLIDLGEDIFEAIVPVAISLIEKDNGSTVAFADISHSDDLKKSIETLTFKKIQQKEFEATPGNIFVEDVNVIPKGVPLEDILSFKDAGINYQRTNVGLKEKGKSDLSARLLYEGSREKKTDVEFWKGCDINAYSIEKNTNRFCRIDVKLKPGERIVLNKDYFEITPKIIWRQTAQYPIATIDSKGIWFGRSIQAGIIKDEWKKKISYQYLCALLNSKYMRSVYEKNVKESGRVFPQVKLEKLKPLPIIVPNNQQQHEFINLVDKILATKETNPQADTSNLESQIDSLVYKLYDLSESEIEMVEKYSVKSATEDKSKNSKKIETVSKKKYLVTTDEEL